MLPCALPTALMLSAHRHPGEGTHGCCSWLTGCVGHDRDCGCFLPLALSSTTNPAGSRQGWLPQSTEVQSVATRKRWHPRSRVFPTPWEAAPGEVWVSHSAKGTDRVPGMESDCRTDAVPSGTACGGAARRPGSESRLLVPTPPFAAGPAVKQPGSDKRRGVSGRLAEEETEPCAFKGCREELA